MKSLIKYIVWMTTIVIWLIGFWLGISWLIFGAGWQRLIGGSIDVVCLAVVICFCLWQDERDEKKKKSYSPKHMARSERK